MVDHYELTAAQILLTLVDLKNRQRFLAARHAQSAAGALERSIAKPGNRSRSEIRWEIMISISRSEPAGAITLVILSDVDGFILKRRIETVSGWPTIYLRLPRNLLLNGR